MDTPSHPSVADRKRALERRLTAALAPADPIEQALLDWLVSSLSPLGSLDVLTAMLERAVRAAYDRGWSNACSAFAEDDRPAPGISALDDAQRHGDERREQS